MEKTFRIVVLISGRGSNLEALLQAIEQVSPPWGQVAAVVSDKRHALGLEHARKRDIETLVVPRRAKERSNQEFQRQLAQEVERFQPDLIVLAGFMRILTAEFVSRFPGRIINIHPSLLPNFRGLHAQQQALDAGAAESGCTVHYVVPEVDAGPIIGQRSVPVLPEDTEDTLSARILKEEHQLLPRVVKEIALGNIRLEGSQVVRRNTGEELSVVTAT